MPRSAVTIASRIVMCVCALGLLLIGLLAVFASESPSGKPVRSPPGTLLLVGGGDLPSSVAARFVRLAGGKDRRFVYIPTAAADEDIDPKALEATFRATFGVDHVTILHTRDRRVADSPAFVRTIREADAVWFGGGRQWRIADAYLGTRTEAALHRLLGRGGVVGGTSAGASILASFLVRGAPEGNWVVDAPGHERGFGLLPKAAVDQHVDRYHREDDVAPIVQAHPGVLGIGLDEATGLLITGGAASVVGDGRVILHDGTTHCGAPYVSLRAGAQFKIGEKLTFSCSSGRSVAVGLVAPSK
jgi:cyanophycinase